LINPKKALVYGVIAISLVVMAVTIPTLIRSPGNNSLAIQSGIQPITNSNNPSIEQFKNQFCGLDSIPNSNNYIMEYRGVYSFQRMRILSHTGWKKDLTMDRYGSMSIRVTR
jgi:hypothetical protein